MKTHPHHEAAFVQLRDVLRSPGSARSKTCPGLEREPTEGSKDASSSRNANAVQETLKALAGAREGCGEPWGAGQPSLVDNGTERLAHHLASSLGDVALRNIAFYRKVARMVPRALVLDALTRARDAQNIRKSRAHLFAFLVRQHLRSSH